MLIEIKFVLHLKGLFIILTNVLQFVDLSISPPTFSAKTANKGPIIPSPKYQMLAPSNNILAVLEKLIFGCYFPLSPLKVLIV